MVGGPRYLSRRHTRGDRKPIHELDVHEGERWFTAFACIDCHGVGFEGIMEVGNVNR